MRLEEAVRHLFQQLRYIRIPEMKDDFVRIETLSLRKELLTLVQLIKVPAFKAVC